METYRINVESWKDLEDHIQRVKDKLNDKKSKNGGIYVSPLLFRGQANSEWGLKTTLERFVENKKCRQNFTWHEYYNILESLLPATDVFTNQKYILPEFKYDRTPVPTGYDLMIYLRHHGFPSPLLDWTRSLHVAAFFAFLTAEKGKDPAIFTYQEDLGEGKGQLVGQTEIHHLGSYVRNTHKRHFLQQCEYTICYQETRSKDNSIEKRTYKTHDSANFNEEQDRLCKYIIPYSEREKIMEKLDSININAFTLFGNEEGLANMLAYREIENGNL
jgi:hypothetical protein